MADPEAPVPTHYDRENARRRQEIAARQNGEYAEVLKLALDTLGPGYIPWMKLTLIDSDYYLRHGNPPAPSATVYKVVRGEERLNENAVYLAVQPDGTVRTAEGYEPLFDGLLHAPHPLRGFDFKGKWAPYSKYTLCWSSLELYEPKSAEALAALRVSRERKKAEREVRRLAEREPLWAPLAERDKREAEERRR